jgi:hypothetical protein
MTTTEEKVYIDDEFYTAIDEASSVNQLIDLFGAEWAGEARNHETEKDAYQRLFEKALSYISTVDDAIFLWNKSSDLICMAAGPSESDSYKEAVHGMENRILERMIDLIEKSRDLEKAYYVFGVGEDELRRRRLIRKIFDKADELGYPIL